MKASTKHENWIAFLNAGQFIHTIEKRQGLKVGCLEEIAFKKSLSQKSNF